MPALRAMQDASNAESAFNCCVCLGGDFTKDDIVFPFGCAHYVCVDCNAALLQRYQMTCPQCRKHRPGVPLTRNERQHFSDFTNIAQLLAESPPWGEDDVPRRHVNIVIMSIPDAFQELDALATQTLQARELSERPEDSLIQRMQVQLNNSITQDLNNLDTVTPLQFRTRAIAAVQRMHNSIESSLNGADDLMVRRRN